jgi:glycosyltransferase involved in cell wall biosynthesis
MIPEKNLTLGVILPNTKIFGGVKRFFEIGNILNRLGHEFMILTPEGERPDWFEFYGKVVKLENIHAFTFDALFITEPDYLGLLKKAKTRLRIFYAILQRSRYLNRVRRDDDLIILANSTKLYKYLGGPRKKNLFKAIGGVDTEKFSFKKKSVTATSAPFIVMAYGRFYKRKKGTSLVVKACERLLKKGYNIKLHLFDTPTDAYAQEQLRKFRCRVPFEFFINYPVRNLQDLYHQADVFVSAERNAGWSNTSAEAMACGVPVIATRSGTEDFVLHKQTGLLVWRHSWFIERAIRELYLDGPLRERLSVNGRKKIEAFSWMNLVENILSITRRNLSEERQS